jgi:NADP-dependent 3-hydroxy acid dehydrogenase YdfG
MRQTAMRRTILITGASSGIGAACVRALRHERLVLVARRADRLAALAREAEDACCLAEDLTDPAAIARVAAAVVPRLDALVNNAGVFATAPADALDAAHLDRMLDLNLRAPMLLTAACLPRMPDGATIVNISSQVADSTFAGCSAYTASKCALEGWSRVLRDELRPRRIRVSVIAPGATDTEVWPADFPADRARMATADDIAAAIRLAITLPGTASVDRLVITPPGGAL